MLKRLLLSLTLVSIGYGQSLKCADEGIVLEQDDDVYVRNLDAQRRDSTAGYERAALEHQTAAKSAFLLAMGRLLGSGLMIAGASSNNQMAQIGCIGVGGALMTANSIVPAYTYSKRMPRKDWQIEEDNTESNRLRVVDVAALAALCAGFNTSGITSALCLMTAGALSFFNTEYKFVRDSLGGHCMWTPAVLRENYGQ